MRLVTFTAPGSPHERLGLLDGPDVVDLAAAREAADEPGDGTDHGAALADMVSFFRAGDGGR